MREAVIVEAVRTPIARGKPGVGDLTDFHATELLALSYREILRRTGLAMSDVDYVAAGCVTQAGEQAGNIARNAWLTMGNDWKTGGTTLDNQCGSAQTANHMISALIGSGSINIGIAAGVEAMSRVGLGANVYNGPGYFIPTEWPWDSSPDQFSSAQRIAKKRGITREMADQLAFNSQASAKRACASISRGSFA